MLKKGWLSTVILSLYRSGNRLLRVRILYHLGRMRHPLGLGVQDVPLALRIQWQDTEPWTV